MSRVEGRERGVTARLQFLASPYPTGPEFYAQYQLDGQSVNQGVLVCRFLDQMSVGGMVTAQVWGHGITPLGGIFASRLNFRLYGGDVLLARGVVIGPPPDPRLGDIALSTSGLPFAF